jgi:hypothetical protein
MKRCLLFLSFGLILAGAVSGQTTGSSQDGAPKVVLTGTVYDINHAVIPFSKVVARSYGVKEYQATTNAEGIYKLELPLDVYKIEASAEWFCPRRIELFRVRSSSTPIRSPLDFVLEVSEGDQPCKQKTMIKKKRPIRQPELFRSIAE